MSTNLSLGDHFEVFIAGQLASGRHADASEVVRDGLRLLEDRQRSLGAFESAIEAGLADIEAGRILDADLAF